MSYTNIFDSHAHYDDEAFDADRETVKMFKQQVETLFQGKTTAKGVLIITPERVIVTTPGPENKKEL